MSDTDFQKGQILYSVTDVSAEAYENLPSKGYRVVDPRTGWGLDGEGNRYRSSEPHHHYMILLREVSFEKDGWVEGKLAIKRVADVDGVIDHETFKERCKAWAEPEEGTPEHSVLRGRKIYALCQELDIKIVKGHLGSSSVDDGEILRMLEQDKKIRKG